MSDIECPYCGHEYDDDGGETNYAASQAPNGTTDEECPECQRVFDVYVEWDPVYYSHKKDSE